MITLPQPFMVIPPDGSDPVHLYEVPEQRPPVFGVALVTPYVAQRWLHAGEAEFAPVVVIDDERQIWAGRRILESTVLTDETARAAIVEIGSPQADTAWMAVVAMRMAYELPEDDDVAGVILSDSDGRVLGGASALFDLRKPTPMMVMIIDHNHEHRYN